jgi:hypothetical protein
MRAEIQASNDVLPMWGTEYIQGDNQSVLANTTIPDSILKKKIKVLHTIAYGKMLPGTNGELCMSKLMTMRLT